MIDMEFAVVLQMVLEEWLDGEGDGIDLYERIMNLMYEYDLTFETKSGAMPK